MSLIIGNNGKCLQKYLMWLCVSMLCLSFAANSQSDNLHDKWQSLLSKHVQPINDGHSTNVDYAGFLKQRPELKAYLKDLENISRSTFDGWSEDKQLAFLINAYNAWTVELILTKYPSLESIKDLGSFFSSPWSKSFIPLLGKTYSLDNIEHDLIRGGNKYNEPRIHFAVNCASIGCPALREEAYTANNLDSQLEQQTERFLSDKTRNFVDDEHLNLSSIFKWYKDDFALGFRGTDSLPTFLALYENDLGLSKAEVNSLLKGKLSIKYIDYNWQLNDAN